mmetsp:Transcript_25228/g.74059  ORF Transcript_25228/g.74059 Transcript_25228/m.74059 type:complete len:245 (-) Transcript_25228:666-1400(-)
MVGVNGFSTPTEMELVVVDDCESSRREGSAVKARVREAAVPRPPGLAPQGGRRFTCHSTSVGVQELHSEGSGALGNMAVAGDLDCQEVRPSRHEGAVILEKPDFRVRDPHVRGGKALDTELNNLHAAVPENLAIVRSVEPKWRDGGLVQVRVVAQAVGEIWPCWSRAAEAPQTDEWAVPADLREFLAVRTRPSLPLAIELVQDPVHALRWPRDVLRIWERAGAGGLILQTHETKVRVMDFNCAQ